MMQARLGSRDDKRAIDATDGFHSTLHEPMGIQLLYAIHLTLQAERLGNANGISASAPWQRPSGTPQRTRWRTRFTHGTWGAQHGVAWMGAARMGEGQTVRGNVWGRHWEKPVGKCRGEDFS